MAGQIAGLDDLQKQLAAHGVTVDVTDAPAKGTGWTATLKEGAKEHAFAHFPPGERDNIVPWITRKVAMFCPKAVPAPAKKTKRKP